MNKAALAMAALVDKISNGLPRSHPCDQQKYALTSIRSSVYLRIVWEFFFSGTFWIFENCSDFCKRFGLSRTFWIDKNFFELVFFLIFFFGLLFTTYSIPKEYKTLNVIQSIPFKKPQ